MKKKKARKFWIVAEGPLKAFAKEVLLNTKEVKKENLWPDERIIHVREVLPKRRKGKK